MRAGNARKVVGRTVGTQASQEVLLHLMGCGLLETSHTHHISCCSHNLFSVAVMKYLHKMQVKDEFILAYRSRGGPVHHAREGTATGV